MHGASSPVGVLALGGGRECRVLLGVPSAHADLCDLTVGGSSGVVRAALMAKGRVPS
jgi:hypothetical protein